MTPAFVVEIVTPKKFVLKGLWFKPKKPKQAIVFVHGLGGSAFSMLPTVSKLVDAQTAVLTFNNRGHDVVSGLSTVGPFKRAWRPRRYGGAAHEVFTDCVDDIEGAITFVRRQGIKNVFLAGHSTGCQKSVYWAYKKGRGVKGIILLAPVSDYAGALERHGKRKLERVAKAARAMVRSGKAHELLPRSLWPEGPDDAQRFLSLYTPQSVEEIFSYIQAAKAPRTLRSVKVPMLVLWAGNDEYSKRPVKAILDWFEWNVGKKGTVAVVPGVPHRFGGGERVVARKVKQFMKECYP